MKETRQTCFQIVREWLNNNKVFLEVFSFLVLGIASIIVSYNSYRISALEFKIREKEIAPTFKIEITDTSVYPHLFKREMKALKVSGYGDNFHANIISFVVLSKYDSLGKRTFTANNHLSVLVDYYTKCVNEIGKKSYIVAYAKEHPESHEYLKHSIEDNPILKHFVERQEKNKKVYYSVELKSILVIHYTDIFGAGKKLPYDLNKGGNTVAAEDVLSYLDRLNKDKVYKLSELSLDKLIKMMDEKK